MELHWLKRAGSDRLIVFMLGWAADHRVVEHIAPEGYDILSVYDYSEGFANESELRAAVEAYPLRYLFSWSFGVWVAEQVFGGCEALSFNRAVAFNGTSFPVNDLYGIEPRRLSVTIRGLSSGGMEAFNRRAYGKHFYQLEPVLSPRPLEKNIAELELLARLGAQPYEPQINWDKAVVGREDLIFSPENMLRFWGSSAEELPLPHYPFAEGEIITRELECR